MKRMLMMALACGVLTMACAAWAGGPIEIKGTITNMEAAAKYIKAESYLQLVRLPVDNKLAFNTDAQGSTVFTSDLAKTAIAKSGKFIIKVASLTPGKYLIATQKLKPYGIKRGGTQMLAKKGAKKILIITIAADDKRGVIDLGELFLPVPK